MPIYKKYKRVLIGLFTCIYMQLCICILKLYMDTLSKSSKYIVVFKRLRFSFICFSLSYHNLNKNKFNYAQENFYISNVNIKNINV